MRDDGPLQFRVGLGSCGMARGGRQVRDALEEAARSAGLRGAVKTVGCNGMCHSEPLVEVVAPGGQRALYGHVTPAAVQAIVREGLERARGRRRRPGLLWRPGRNGTGGPARLAPIDLEQGDAARFLAKQKRIVLENCGEIDPESLDDYLERGGYEALATCLRSLAPGEVIDLVSRSGLRGRGGAGFSTGAKWALARAQGDPVKYVILNGDEGDPGAFMDRLVLESDPFRVIEGLSIAAYATGASQGYLYIRAEYPHALRRVRRALEEARARGYLDGAVLGTRFSLELEVREGAGAFVCGEETALIASIEGRRGVPRLRPPYPVEKGLWGHPTVINNVETLACVPWIVRHGPEAFAALGTERSRGTKVFALAGKVRRGGLIEVPMGITIREIVEDIGGGVPEGHRLKAIQIGGPAGGCLPAALAGTPVDFEELARTGAIMGSGGLVVLDDTDCMVDMARFFLQFTQAESCGKCTFCRIGTKRMLEILERICGGAARPRDLEDLEELSQRAKRASLCGLGQTAPNPVLTTLRYFRDEYEAHLKEKRCPARRCKALVRYRVTGDCIGCTLCAQVCPVDAIAWRPYEKHEIDDARCTRCGMCALVCRDGAVEVS